MMVEETKKVLDLIDEMMELLGGYVELSMLTNMDGDEFKLMQLYLKMIDVTKDFAVKQAELMDNQTEKLDLILSKLEEMEKKS